MIASQASHSTETFFLNAGQVAKILINFNSYKATGNGLGKEKIMNYIA